jgi:hypothetical protein
VRSALINGPVSPVEEKNVRSDETGLNAIAETERGQASATRSTASFFSYLRSTADAAHKRLAPTLRELSKAEDTADEYLNRLGASFGQLLKDVVTIVPPEESKSLDEKDGEVLFDDSAEKKTLIQFLSLRFGC